MKRVGFKKPTNKGRKITSDPKGKAPPKNPLRSSPART
jgi:hypothetical protein